MDRMNGMKRTRYCGDFSMETVGEEVVVAGWAAKRRNLGSLLFVDLRDRTGIVQLAFDDDTDRDLFEKAETIRTEFVLMAKGTVRERSSKNKDIPTGDVEIFVTELKILGKAETTPFEITDDVNTAELTRLKYRYLDLRRPALQKNILMRHRITKIARDFFDDNGFIEIETPMLIKSTPEGARDYLVPSRVHQGEFYALPQSPQLYKQLSMVAGFDRYMQVARCFRDEDLRADGTEGRPVLGERGLHNAGTAGAQCEHGAPDQVCGTGAAEDLRGGNALVLREGGPEFSALRVRVGVRVLCGGADGRSDAVGDAEGADIGRKVEGQLTALVLEREPVAAVSERIAHG